MHRFFSLLWLYYKMVLIRQATLIRRLYPGGRYPPLPLLLTVEVGKVVVVFISFLLLRNTIGTVSHSVFYLLLLSAYCLTQALLFRDPVDRVLERCRFDYFRLSHNNDHEFLYVTLIRHWLVFQLLALPTKLPIIAFYILTRMYAFLPLLLFVDSFALLLYLIIQGRREFRHPAVEIVALAANRVLLAALSYTVFRAILYFILLSRSLVEQFGLTPALFVAFDREVSKLVVAYPIATRLVGWLTTPAYVGLYAVGAFAIFVLVATFRRRVVLSERREEFKVSVLQVPVNVSLRSGDSAVFLKDVLLLNSELRRLGHRQLDMLISPELAMIVGGNTAFLGVINNGYIHLFIFFVQSCILFAGALRGICNTVPSVFRFEDDLRRVELYALSPNVDADEMLAAKHVLLDYFGRMPVLMQWALYTMHYMVLTGPVTLVILVVTSGLMTILYRKFVAFVLRTYHKAFRIVFERREQVYVESITSLQGFGLLLAADTVVLVVVIQLTILAAVTCSMLRLLEGGEWAYFALGVMGLWCGGIVVSAGQGRRRKERRTEARSHRLATSQ